MHVINQQYLQVDNSEFDKIQNSWINSEIKSLSIKSACGTGKTLFLKNVTTKYCKAYGLERILYLSYRKSLSINVTNSLQGFTSYLDVTAKELNSCNKVICSPDSIRKVENRKFDMIIIDEVESFLNHFSATLPSMKQYKYSFYDILIDLCNNAKKVILLDNDIGIRSEKFVSHYKGNGLEQVGTSVPTEVVSVVNTYVPVKYEFMCLSDECMFKNKIDTDLKSGKKVVFCSMLKRECDNIYEHYKTKYNCVSYTRDTEDSIKKQLNKCEDVWDKLDLLIYSPTIEAGVDFSKLHFDKLYVYCYAAKSQEYCSVSQRSLYQMIRRVRYIADNKVYMFTKNLPTNRAPMPLAEKQFVKNLDEILYINSYESANRVASVFLNELRTVLQRNGHTMTHIWL